ncbi:MAG: lytic transglycosylase domain-containing protein [Candidatus Competibacterales bacterium]
MAPLRLVLCRCLVVLACCLTIGILANITALPLAAAPSTAIDTAAFAQWRQAFRARATQRGISVATLRRTLDRATASERVLALSEHQPEFTRPIWEYLDGAVSHSRIQRGRGLLRHQGSLLARIEARFGVDRAILVAIWGLETDYGRVFGGFDVIDALATLAHGGRRQAFGEEQLLAALELVDGEIITPRQLRGSWAGAMGHTQFIPTTYRDYAVDFDGDSRRDLWTPAPPMGSAAPEIGRAGWRAGGPRGV